MYNRGYRVVLLTGSLAISSAAIATPFSFNARQDAMGGAGVSTANYLSAPFYNPAQLALADKSENWGLILPVAGAELFDKEDIIGKTEEFQDTYDDFQSAYQAFTHDPTVDNAERLLDADAKATAELKALQGVSGYARAGAGAAIALPSEVLSVALFYNGYVDGQGFTDVDMDDFTVYTVDGIELSIPHSEDEMQSQGIVMGAGVQDVGLSLAKSFDTQTMTWAIGVTPKLQKLEVYNYVIDAANTKFRDMRNSKYLKSETGLNMDAGLSAVWQSGWHAGLAIKNLVTRELESKEISDVQSAYRLHPIPTASVAYQLNHVLLTSDLDLVARKRFTELTGTHNTYHADNDDLQAFSFGAEWAVINWMQLRGGYRRDLQSNLDDAITAGVGLIASDSFHFDLAGTYGGNREYGASLQTSLTF